MENMNRILNSVFNFIPDWVSFASLLVSSAAVLIARNTLSQAKKVAERERRDWAQRKWFDLYFQMNDTYDFLDEFRTNRRGMPPSSWDADAIQDWNHLMRLIRKVHAMAMVFPKNQVIDKLISATAVFSEKQEALSVYRLKTIQDILDDIRIKALIDSSVLNTIKDPE
jgi:hypothetical protein